MRLFVAPPGATFQINVRPPLCIVSGMSGVSTGLYEDWEVSQGGAAAPAGCHYCLEVLPRSPNVHFCCQTPWTRQHWSCSKLRVCRQTGNPGPCPPVHPGKTKPRELKCDYFSRFILTYFLGAPPAPAGLVLVFLNTGMNLFNAGAGSVHFPVLML